MLRMRTLPACAAVTCEAEEVGKMTRRKREIAGLANEQDFPHLVELTFPPGGFRSVLLEIDAFHRERRIPVRRGRSRHEVKQVYIRFCFPDAATAEAISQSLWGRVLDPRASRVARRRNGVKEDRDGQAANSLYLPRPYLDTRRREHCRACRGRRGLNRQWTNGGRLNRSSFSPARPRWRAGGQ